MLVIVWGEKGGGRGTYAIPQPVGRGGESYPAGANWQGEDLANHDPSARAPGRRKEEYVDAYECDHGADCVLVLPVCDADNCYDEFANQHPQRTPYHDRSSSHLLNDVETNGCGAYVHERGNEGDQERVMDRAELSEERGSEVENEVYTGPLLHHLQRGTEDGAAEVGGRVQEGSAETVGPAGEVAGLGDHAELVFVVGDYFGEFFLHQDLDVLVWCYGGIGREKGIREGQLTDPDG